MCFIKLFIFSLKKKNNNKGKRNLEGIDFKEVVSFSEKLNVSGLWAGTRVQHQSCLYKTTVNP